MREARRTQQFFGGQLPSHLLKLGFVDERILGHALSEVTGVPYATYDMLRAVPAEAQKALSADLLETHRACPLALETDRLKLAMLNPRDAVAIREFERHTGLSIEPWVTIEYRLYQALERYYRIRFDGLRSLTLAPPEEMHQRRSIAGAEAQDGESNDAADEVDLQVGLDGLPLDAEVPDASIWQRGIELDPEIDDPAADAPTIAVPTVDAPPETAPATALLSTPATFPATATDPFDRLEQRLSAGPDRDEIAEALLEYGTAHAPRAAVFAVTREGIRGINARGRGFSGLSRIDLPRGGQTVLDAGIDGDGPYYGVVPHVPPNRELYSALGGQIPPSVVILPVVVRGRTVAMLYMDNDGLPMAPPDDARLRRIAAKAGLAFEILILRNKLRSL